MSDNNSISRESKSGAMVEASAMSVETLAQQVQYIQQIMDEVMKKDEHYGTIPGTQKPTLLKPGAEKLCLTFRLNPNYDIIEQVRDKEFIAYTVKCTLSHIPSGNSIASGIGSCNSREKKYRFRWEPTDKKVPKDYWKHRDQSLIGGKGFKSLKVDGEWYIAEQKENTNPWDLDNTLIKMACKRALVAATLNATAASDIFTQDLEDTNEAHPTTKNTPAKDPKASSKGQSIDDQTKSQKETNATIQGKMDEYGTLVKELQSLGIKPSKQVTSIINEAIKLGDDWDAKIAFLKQEIAKYRGE